MLIHYTNDARVVHDDKEDLNRLVRAYNENKLTWNEYLHQVIFSAQRALRLESESK